MRLIYKILIIFLFVFITFGTISGCLDDSVVEFNCVDGKDDDNDGKIDCADKDCSGNVNCIGITCDDFIEAYCNRVVDCDGGTFENCIVFAELFIFSLDCNDIEDLPTVNECITDLENFDCEDLLNDLGPVSCAPLQGVCDVCDIGEDCGEGLICVDCLEDCTGVAERCVGFFFDQVCEDGFVVLLVEMIIYCFVCSR